ncbi:MAG: deoxyguanosinetriphosphate triphosphohydrolase family protein [Gammaproteobacteria bacterium]|nr:deoxyguanosinetriphosphate triphosphohydrolase family protein [Gammaproteobacteria bacterium]
MWTERRSGKSHQRGEQDRRGPYERDRTRVIHCPAFRRLQRKTQILGTDEGDFHRTRLTHSLEVSSIGCSVVRRLATNSANQAFMDLLPDEDLISVICLLHDIGHPPFGHGGEVALNYMMRDHGGFEGNGQTLRLLTKLENSYGEFGLDLTRRALLGILKYPVNRARIVSTVMPVVRERNMQNEAIRVNDWLPPKAYFENEVPEVDWLLQDLPLSDKTLFQDVLKEPSAHEHGCSKYHSLDCSIMDIADDIAYGVHDLEDAIQLRLIGRATLDTPTFRALLADTALAERPLPLLDALFDDVIFVRKQAIGEMVNYFVTSTRIEVANEDFQTGLLKYNVYLLPEAKALLGALVACIYEHVIDSQESRTFEYGGQTVVLRLFDAMSSNPMGLLNVKNRALFAAATDEASARRVICDVIANMTDEYAYRMHERLFGFNTRTIFERL